jgi:hypothetical protein
MHRCAAIAITAVMSLLALPVAAQSTPSLNEQYTQCTQTVTSDPAGTYKRARAWYGQSQSLASQHCMALALYNLADYAGAARALESILQGLKPAEGSLWINMKSQAARAQAAAGNATAALTHLQDALYWAADKQMDDAMLPLLLQRAALYDSRNEDLLAIQDYDHAMSIRPATATRLQRARLLLKMGKTAQAVEDIDIVLQSEPANKEAQSLRALASR